MASLALLIGLFSIAGAKGAAWLVQQGLQMPYREALHLGGADVWIFMSVKLFVVAYIFKRGIYLQTEQDLTV